MKFLDNIFQAILSLFGRGNKNEDTTYRSASNTPGGTQADDDGSTQSQNYSQTQDPSDNSALPPSLSASSTTQTSIQPMQPTGASGAVGVASDTPSLPSQASDETTYYSFPLPSDVPSYGGFPSGDTSTYYGFPLPSEDTPTYGGFPAPERPQIPDTEGTLPTKPGMPGRLPGETPPIVPPSTETVPDNPTYYGFPLPDTPTYGGFPDTPSYGGFPSGDSPTYGGFPTYTGFPPASDYADFSTNNFEVKEDGTYVSVTNDNKDMQGGWGSPASDTPADPTNGVISVDNNKDTDPLSIKDDKRPSHD